LLTILEGCTDEAQRAGFSSDGQRIATSCSDGAARIWDSVNGHLLATVQGHTNVIADVAFSTDGQRIVTASYDQTAAGVAPAHAG